MIEQLCDESGVSGKCKRNVSGLTRARRIIYPSNVSILKGGTVSATQQLLRFGVFELNLDTEELRRSKILIKLPPQPFRLLVLLASRAGQVVTREDIQQEFWGDEIEIDIDFERRMNQCIKQIRNALADNASQPVYIETVHRHGYRFIAPVESRTVAAPLPKVTESVSAAQERVIVDRVLARIAEASAMHAGQTSVGAPATTAVLTEPAPAPEVEPAVSTSRRRIRLGFLLIAGAVIAAVAGIVYWYLS